MIESRECEAGKLRLAHEAVTVLVFILGHTSLADLLSLGLCGPRVLWQLWGYFGCLVCTGWTLPLHLIALDASSLLVMASPSLLLRVWQNVAAFMI